MNKFNENDLVVVKNTGLVYSGYFGFFKENDMPIDVAARFAYYNQPGFGDICRVICKGKEIIGDGAIYCIESADMHRLIYLVNEKAIEKIGGADMDVYDEAIGDTYSLACIKL